MFDEEDKTSQEKEPARLRFGRGLLIWYLVIVSMIFLLVYSGSDRPREMGLYVFLMVLNLPASLVVMPATESFSTYWGLTLGAPSHVIITQLGSMILNTTLFVGVYYLFKVLLFKFKKWFKK